jgi:hypothetical protein
MLGLGRSGRCERTSVVEAGLGIVISILLLDVWVLIGRGWSSVLDYHTFRSVSWAWVRILRRSRLMPVAAAGGRGRVIVTRLRVRGVWRIRRRRYWLRAWRSGRSGTMREVFAVVRLCRSSGSVDDWKGGIGWMMSSALRCVDIQRRNCFLL